ncbi:RusA family crossover junction endodeoxyribonuclease [Aminobacter sp. P9b]|uniref:RusA family crossover junction endodeoxyribonuclease n=1 Tax=Aminobacter sp. P9b TaxID=3133697 RepID=UPI003255AA13
MEIEFPIEFLVQGTPVSLQAKKAASRDEWKERVKEASRTSVPNPHLASNDRMSVTLFYLPPERMQGDIDNIVKPILDALSRHIYIDDVQVERVVVQKFEPNNVYTFENPTTKFSEALDAERPVLYVKISNNPHEDFR